jgi:hypothetical protein
LIGARKIPEKVDPVHLSGRLRDGGDRDRDEMERKGQRPDANAGPTPSSSSQASRGSTGAADR